MTQADKDVFASRDAKLAVEWDCVVCKKNNSESKVYTHVHQAFLDEEKVCLQFSVCSVHDL